MEPPFTLALPHVPRHHHESRQNPRLQDDARVEPEFRLPGMDLELNDLAVGLEINEVMFQDLRTPLVVRVGCEHVRGVCRQIGEVDFPIEVL